jgi:membrane protease YdiL (CAAX protease family)
MMAHLWPRLIGRALSRRLISRSTASRDKGGLAPDLAIGVALGAAFFSVVMAVLLATGAYTLTGPTAAAAWLPLADSLEGTVEELIFRGSIFRLLSGVLGIWWALGLSSASFGAWHLVKPGAEMMAVLGVICAGGIPLAALYMLTGRLWASIGYHVAWNFTEAFVFGAHVSGSDLGPSLYHVRPAAGVDTLWTGGEFGPEASIATVVLGLMVGAALLVLAKRRS